MARIRGLSEREAGPVGRFAYRFSRRRLGKVAEPLMVTAHHPQLLLGYGAMELALDRSRSEVDYYASRLLSVGTEVLVESPPALVEAVRRKAEEVLDLYRSLDR